MEIMRYVSRHIELHSWHSKYHMLYHYFNNWLHFLDKNKRKKRFVILKYMISRVSLALSVKNPEATINKVLTSSLFKLIKARKGRNTYEQLLR